MCGRESTKGVGFVGFVFDGGQIFFCVTVG